MSGVLSDREIDELMLSVAADAGVESGHPLPSFYPRLALRLKDLLEALPGAKVSVDRLERTEAPSAGALSFPERRFASIDCGAPGPRFLAALGDSGARRLARLVAGAAGSPPPEGEAEDRTIADLYARFAAALRRALPEAIRPKEDETAASLAYPLPESEFRGEEWAPGATFTLSVDGEALLVSLYPSKAASEGLLDPPVPPPARRVAIYDFRRPERFSRPVLGELWAIHERFARRAGRALSAALGTYVYMRVSAVDQLTIEEYLRSVPTPTFMAVLSMGPLAGRAVLEISPELSSELLDRAMGGPGPDPGARPRGALSGMDQDVMGALLPGLVMAVAGAWAPVARIEPKIEGFESDPCCLEMAPPAEMAALVGLEASVEGREAGSLGVCLPYGLAEPLLGGLAERRILGGAKRGTAPLADAEAIGALPLTRYARFAPRFPGLAASALARVLAEAGAGGSRVEAERLGRYEYAVPESR